MAANRFAAKLLTRWCVSSSMRAQHSSSSQMRGVQYACRRAWRVPAGAVCGAARGCGVVHACPARQQGRSVA